MPEAGAEGPGGDRRREVSPVIPQTLLRYVRRAAGPEALDRVLAALPGPPSLAELSDPAKWWASEEVIRLAAAAAEACGEADVGRRTGTEMFRADVGTGTVDMFASGSLPETYDVLVVYATRMSTGRRLEVVEAGDGELLVDAHYSDPASAHPFYCGVAAGYYAEVPSLFAQVGDAVEIQCQLRGASHCRYRITWAPDPRRPAPYAARAGDGDRVNARVGQLEALRRMASDLVRARDVDEALARITELAGTAVQAPRYLLAVRVHDGDRLRVHQCGFRTDAVEPTAQRLLVGALSERDGVLVADVASPRQHYGRLAAFFPRDARFTDVDRRTFEAYADHATAALELVASLEQAHQDRDTAQALLDLAGELARVGSVPEIAARLVAAVPTIVGADTAGVWLWDAGGRSLRIEAFHAVDPDRRYVGPRRISSEELPGLAALAEHPQPRLIQQDEALSPLRDAMAGAHMVTGAAVPIVSHGEFFGMVSAGFVQRRDADGALLARIAGLADHAATAFENARLLEQIRHQALHDPLTGLPNRPLIEDRAVSALRLAGRSGATVGLLFIDLDRFKDVNDTLGHDRGDELICQVAGRLAGALRQSDTLARLGGDEFVVLLPQAESGSDVEVAARRLLEALEEPFALSGDQRVAVSASIGVACAPQHGTDYAALMQRADAAMYDAKARGRATYLVFAEGRLPSGGEPRDLEVQLREAIELGRLRVHYQPRVEPATRRIVTMEALVRWQHPEQGLLGPVEFLPVAEDCGLIAELDAWVRRSAFVQLREWLADGHDVRIALNVSGRDLGDPAFSARLAAELTDAELPAQRVEVEISDRVVMDVDRYAAALDRLRALGVRVTVDEFGAGISGVARLQRAPVDTIAIDRALVRDLCDRNAGPEMARALVALGHALGLEVVAQGVDSEEQVGALVEHHFDLAQGYLFSPPVDASAATLLLTLRHSASAACDAGRTGTAPR